MTNPVSPRAVDGRLADMVGGAIELAETWVSLAHQCGAPTIPTSRCAYDGAHMPAEVERPAHVSRAIATDAVIYVAAATQQLRALAHLAGPEIVLTGWTVTRTVAEHCGRVAWLLDPAITPNARLARWYMEQIVGIQMARLSLDQKRQRANINQIKANRDSLVSQARRVFPDLAVFTTDALNHWSVGGESYASLSAAVNRLGHERLNSKRLYDVLSTYTHPSLYRLHTQTRSEQNEDHIRQVFIADPEIVRWQFAIACACVQQAAHYVGSYLALDTTSLETWADHHPLLTSWTLDALRTGEDPPGSPTDPQQP
ncbi:MAG: hypothetical protein WAV90_14900 [Gordonia amarae]